MKKTKSPVVFPPNQPLKNSLILLNEGWLRAYIEKRSKEDLDRLLALAEYRGIQTDNCSMSMFDLALSLAQEMYPELKGPGRDKKWGNMQQGYLIVEMERIIEPARKDHGISYAAHLLATREPWKSFVESNVKDSDSNRIAEVLRTRYTKFRRHPWAAVMRAKYENNYRGKDPSEWEKQVIESVIKSPV